MLSGVTLMFASGIPLFMSESIKAYYSFAFWIKMASLFLVLLYTFTLRRRVTGTDLVTNRPLLARSLAVMSLSLWFGVAWGGGWVGFFLPARPPPSPQRSPPVLLSWGTPPFLPPSRP